MSFFSNCFRVIKAVGNGIKSGIKHAVSVAKYIVNAVGKSLVTIGKFALCAGKELFKFAVETILTTVATIALESYEKGREAGIEENPEDKEKEDKEEKTESEDKVS